jgi:hypothetical protein
MEFMKRSLCSWKLQFENFGFKGGLTYKLSGKQLLTFNGAHLTKRQRFGIAFRIREQLDSWRTAKWEYSLDATYIFRSPNSKCGWQVIIRR